MQSSLNSIASEVSTNGSDDSEISGLATFLSQAPSNSQTKVIAKSVNEMTSLLEGTAKKPQTSLLATELFGQTTATAVSAPKSFLALQKWEGFITSVSEDTFTARLMTTVGVGEEEEAIIYRREIDRTDQEMIQVGAIFYWSIGYLDGPSGRQRTSMIVFRRLPKRTKQELERARVKAIEWMSLLNNES